MYVTSLCVLGGGGGGAVFIKYNRVVPVGPGVF